MISFKKNGFVYNDEYRTKYIAYNDIYKIEKLREFAVYNNQNKILKFTSEKIYEKLIIKWMEFLDKETLEEKLDKLFERMEFSPGEKFKEAENHFETQLKEMNNK